MVPVWNVRKLILNGIQNTRSQKKLLLRFQAGREEEWLHRDIASFLVSEVQRLYPGYECGGMVL